MDTLGEYCIFATMNMTRNLLIVSVAGMCLACNRPQAVKTTEARKESFMDTLQRKIRWLESGNLYNIVGGDSNFRYYGAYQLSPTIVKRYWAGSIDSFLHNPKLQDSVFRKTFQLYDTINRPYMIYRTGRNHAETIMTIHTKNRKIYLRPELAAAISHRFGAYFATNYLNDILLGGKTSLVTPTQRMDVEDYLYKLDTLTVR